MKYVFLVLWLALTAGVAYAGWRGWQAWHPWSWARTTWVALVGLLYASLLAALALGRGGASEAARVVAVVGYSALVFLLYAVMTCLVADVARLVGRLAGASGYHLEVMHRAVLLVGLAVTLLAMGAGNRRFRHPEVMHMTLTLDSRPPQGRELTVVAASDLHLGQMIGKERLRGFVQLINDQHPDVVLLAGDVYDGALAPVVQQRMADDLRAIRAPFGVYAVPGNHEYIGGDVDAKADYLRQGGVRLLRDSVVSVDGGNLYIAGRDDRSNPRRKPLTDLVAPLDSAKPVVVLDHQPVRLSEAEDCGVQLQLSGHTHEGQFFPVNLVVRAMYENAYGYSRRGGTQYYVSSGLGLWGPPYRIGTQSELLVIRLRY